jgi:hypothetical protein
MSRPFGVWLQVDGRTDWICVGTYRLLRRAHEVERERRYDGKRYITRDGVRATTVQPCECDECVKTAVLIH